jgi:Zn-dependent M16 (insulinase) family peptidase
MNTENFGFELIRHATIAEINSQVFLYRHIKSGAELLSVVNDDENKVFGTTFRTPPSDSTGLPHIMEHSVLCGSRKYPVKEPFVELIKGSLNTFLNAFTYPDKTCYPVASTNLQDFYNLVDVYLDAIFYPLITPQTLMQEGWHYELESPDQEMIFKGVVFNEMKGAFSSPDDILGDESIISLLPDTPYGFQSGGDPEVIPDLTYEQFKQFHTTFYHPSNARIFFYGDDDPQERLRLLDVYLKDFSAKPNPSELPIQKPFSAPVRKTIPYDSGENSENAKAYLTINWLLPQGNDPELVLGLGILDHVLLGTPASPLRKKMIESGLGEDIVGRGMEKELKQMAFSTGLRGIELENIDSAENLILSSIEDIAHQGIDPKTIEASLNTIEFNLRENNTGSYPRGLLIMLRALSTWIYDLDPMQPLAFEKPLQAIKNRFLRGEKYFENLIETYFLNNQHRVTVILTPDENLGKLRAEKETKRLYAARRKMNTAELKAVIDQTLELKRLQETPDSPEALATIPTLKRTDLDPDAKTLPNLVINQTPYLLLFHDLFTSNILYVDLGLNLKPLSKEQLPFMRLFSRAMVEMGTETESFVELIQRIGRETGGIHHNLYTSANSNAQGTSAYLFLRAKAMTNQTPALLSILKDILTTTNFNDRERFRQMALEEKSSLEAGLVPSGHRVVNNRLKARFSEAAWATEQMSGVDYLRFVRQLIEKIDSDWDGIVAILQQIRTTLVNQSNMVFNVTLDDAGWQSIESYIQSFIGSLPNQSLMEQSWQTAINGAYEGLTIPSQVNFVGKGANLYELGYQQHGSINVISQYLRSTWLWEKVRVQGGAYGGFCTFDRLSGIFTFLSYRDPNLMSTLENFDRTVEFLHNLELSDAELTKSLIGSIGELDAYQLPDAKGHTAMLRYLLNISDAERQSFRDELLQTNSTHFHAFADVLERFNQVASVIVLGSGESIQKANQEKPAFLQVEKIM